MIDTGLMATAPSKEALIAAVEAAVGETLAYFDGPGQRSTAMVGDWGAWDILAHLWYFHYATTWGIRSSMVGGPAWKLPGTADEINAACLPLHRGESFDQLIAELRLAQERLLRAAREAADLDAPAFERTDGTTVSIRERLETIARHWNGHLRALQEAGG